MKKKVVILGSPGSGKSSVARVLAERYAQKVIDLDGFIEAQEGKRVTDIIRVEGLEKFRAIESRALRLALDADCDVLTLGGGTLTVAENRLLVSSHALAIRLTATLSTLLCRVEAEEREHGGITPVRPLLVQKGKSIETALAELLETREEQYRIAHITIWTDLLTPEDVAKSVYGHLRNGDLADVLPHFSSIPFVCSPGKFVSEVRVGELNQLALWLRKNRLQVQKVALVIDEQVNRCWNSQIQQAITEAGLSISALVEIPSGEREKNLQNVQMIAERLLESNFSRSDILIACGGGVVGDLGGLVASLFMRGLRLIQIPTTVLAQGDSALGGKTAVNLGYGKNVIGTFYPAELTLSDVAFFRSLPEREYIGGFAEIVKHGFLVSAEFLDWFEAHIERIKEKDVSCLKEIVEFSSRTKLSFVATDLEDKTGQRALLNFGHTIGHAVEELTGFSRYLHGEAVSIGMAEAMRLGESLGVTETSVRARAERMLSALGLPIEIPSDLVTGKMETRLASTEQSDLHKRWIESIMADKKRSSSKVKFVVIKREGDAFTVDLSPADIVTHVLRRS